MKRPYRTLPHTADLKIAVVGDSPNELFKHAALATLDLLYGAKRKKGTEAFGLLVSAESEEVLLVSFLNEIVYAATTEGKSLASIDEIRVEGHRVRARFRLGRGLELKQELKSATYHNLEIRKAGGQLETEIVFDV